MTKNDDYAAAGVNIDLGDDASKVLYNASLRTWDNRKGLIGEVVTPRKSFSGLRFARVENLPKGAVMGAGLDGVGTKVEVGERMNAHQRIAYDLIAMVCDDAVVRGAEPVHVGSVLDVNTLGDDTVTYIDAVKQLALGYIAAAKDAGVAIINGEVAELGSRVSGYGPFNYNWAAAAIWFSREDRMLYGDEPQVGDALVGLRETGFRSNGLSLVRAALSQEYGHEWHKSMFNGDSLGSQVLQPSRIYTKAVLDMIGGYSYEPKVKVTGVAHITGGGLPGKLGRMLEASGLGAMINSPYDPCALMSHIQQIRGTKDLIAYKTWNCGQGMVIATPDPDGVRSVASAHGIESKVLGHLTKDPRIRIRSRGFNQPGEILSF